MRIQKIHYLCINATQAAQSDLKKKAELNYKIQF